MNVDAVIFGGGVAGLWLLDELTQRGARVLLLEAAELGRGQTVAAQGIIHGGLKYTLQGLLTSSAANIREMPLIWRECLAGTRQPDLSGTRIRSECCYLWRTDSLSSRLGMIGARFGLRVAPSTLEPDARPAVLAGCPGTVARMDEQVIATDSLIADFARRLRPSILQIDAETGLEFETSAPGIVERIRLTEPGSGDFLTLSPRWVIFTAGAGNAALRSRVGLSAETMQRRPLHMLLLRGDLPEFNGHCVDGAKTRVTVTSDRDSAGRTVWHVGGQLAEDGVALDEESLIAHAREEMKAVMPRVDFSGVEWATYRVDRAEGRTANGGRPDSVQILQDGNCLTAWPTKLALAPELSQALVARLGPLGQGEPWSIDALENWPRPAVAQPPWETCRNWTADCEVSRPDQLRRAA